MFICVGFELWAQTQLEDVQFGYLLLHAVCFAKYASLKNARPRIKISDLRPVRLHTADLGRYQEQGQNRQPTADVL